MSFHFHFMNKNGFILVSLERFHNLALQHPVAIRPIENIPDNNIHRPFLNENLKLLFFFSSLESRHQTTYTFFSLHFDNAKHLNCVQLLAAAEYIFFCWFCWNYATFSCILSNVFYLSLLSPNFYWGNKFQTKTAISNELPQIVT